MRDGARLLLVCVLTIFATLLVVGISLGRAYHAESKVAQEAKIDRALDVALDEYIHAYRSDHPDVSRADRARHRNRTQ